MLSNVDIRRILGKQIGIYPFNSENIDGSSIYLTASKLAWSLNKKKKAIDDNGEYITIDAHDTVIVITTESVFLGSSYAGYCISRVSSGPHGLGAICCPVKPQWIGRLLITLHNYSDQEYKIKIGESIAVLTIHKLHSASEYSDPKQNSRFELLAEVGIQVSREDIKDINHKYYTIQKELNHCMETSDSYKNYMKIYNPSVNKKRNAQIITASIMVIILVALIILILNINEDSLKIIITASFGTILTYFLIMIKDIVNEIKGD